MAGEPICQEIDQQVQAFLSRPLHESGYAYVYLDATYLKGRLGIKVGDSETEGYWSEFNRCAEGKAYASLKERGLTSVKLVVSDAHFGLTKSIRRQLQGCVWQRRTERCAC